MGSQGAGIQNALWAPRGCKILELVSPRYFSGVYWTLAQSLQQDYGLVTGITEPDKHPIEAGVTCDPKLVLRALDALLERR
jgi:capsular polysaccharide biosynthesis protein